MAVFKPKQLQRTIAEHIEDHMRAIAQLFPDAKLTLVVRDASLEGAVIFTNDEAHDVIAAIQSHGLKRPSTVVTH